MGCKTSLWWLARVQYLTVGGYRVHVFVVVDGIRATPASDAIWSAGRSRVVYEVVTATAVMPLWILVAFDDVVAGASVVDVLAPKAVDAALDIVGTFPSPDHVVARTSPDVVRLVPAYELVVSVRAPAISVAPVRGVAAIDGRERPRHPAQRDQRRDHRPQQQRHILFAVSERSDPPLPAGPGLCGLPRIRLPRHWVN
jgi:hypothetical protein